jgi:hypothetical protein
MLLIQEKPDIFYSIKNSEFMLQNKQLHQKAQ